MTAFNYTTHFTVEIDHMTEFVTPRKRKSEVKFTEPNTKKSNSESEKLESRSKKIIRKFSTRLKIFTPSKTVKSKYQMDENIFTEDVEKEVLLGTEEIVERDPNICSSMTYFGAPMTKKNGVVNDRVSNSSDNSRQSSSSMSQQLKIGVDLFNRDQKCGVEYLKNKGVVDNEQDLAELFIKRKGISKMRLFEFLTAKENRAVHKCFCNQLELKFKTIPEVLREYLKYSFITGEYNTMLDIVDVLSHAYIGQHSEGAVMGLNVSQVITIIQYLITFNANEQKANNKISRECFIEYLQTSLTEENKISRQLASCLYLEMCESPLITTMDERYQNLDKIRKTLTDFPKDFSIMQYHRYIICHVDLSKVVLPSNNSEKPSFHDRTVFLFNDILIIAKKNWSYDSNSYKVKQIINLSQIKCALVTRSASYSNPSINTIRIVQIINANSTDILLNLYSKLFEDLMSFYTSLEHSIEVHKSLVEFYRDYESSSR